MILKHIPPEDLAKVNQNAGLRNIKDYALAYETAAEELFKNIQEAFIEDKCRIQMADGVKEQKNQALENATRNRSLTQAKLLAWQEHYDAISHQQYQELQQANYVFQQAEYEYGQVSEEADRCRKVAMCKKHLGMLAIRVMLDDQERHTLEAAQKIWETLDAQHRAKDDEASSN